MMLLVVLLRKRSTDVSSPPLGPKGGVWTVITSLQGETDDFDVPYSCVNQFVRPEYYELYTSKVKFQFRYI